MKKIMLILTLIVTMMIPVCVQADAIEYTFDRHEKENNNTVGTANRLWIRKKIQGVINEYNDEDWYYMFLDHSGVLNIEFVLDRTSQNKNVKDGWKVTLLDKNRNELYSLNSVKTNKAIMPNLTLVPGKYFIKVAPYYPNSYEYYQPIGCLYSLKAFFKTNQNWAMDDFNNSTIKKIQFGKTYYGSIYKAGDIDTFRVVTNKSGTATVEFTIDDSVRDDQIRSGWYITITDKNRNVLEKLDYVTTGKSIRINHTGNININVTNQSNSYDYFTPGLKFHIKVTK